MTICDRILQTFLRKLPSSCHQVFYQYSSPQYLASTLSIFALPTGFAVKCQLFQELDESEV